MDEETIRKEATALAEQTRFLTLVRSVEEERNARLLIKSLRTFGGRLSNCPVWVFQSNLASVSHTYPGLEGVHFVPLVIEDEFRRYFFADKAYACAKAEGMAGQEVCSLVWLSTQCLIVNPPILFLLAPSCDAAFRPVHIKNIGLSAQEPIDDYWKEIYRTVGIDDVPFAIESFIGSQKMRPYFNTHIFAIDPSKGVLQTWLECFKTMVSNQEFQSVSCRDEEHQIFLHQAILSALVTKSLDWDRIRILPPEYSYPLHFHQEIPRNHRPRTLNSQVCPVYEGVFRYPDTLNGIEDHEPLRSWLIKHAQTKGGI